MNVDKLLCIMGSLMKLKENMEIQKFGNIILKRLTIFQLEPLLKERYYASMEDFLLKSKLLIKSELLIVESKFHKIMLFVESCGRILQNKLKIGYQIKGGLVIYMVKKWLKTLIS